MMRERCRNQGRWYCGTSAAGFFGSTGGEGSADLGDGVSLYPSFFDPLSFYIIRQEAKLKKHESNTTVIHHETQSFFTARKQRFQC